MPSDRPDTFLEATRQMIRKCGLDGFMPTLLLPSQDHLVVLDGAPEGADHAAIARKWAASKAGPGESYMLAFRVDDARFAIVRYADGVLSEHIHALQDA
jgi:hypothetical protein